MGKLIRQQKTDSGGTVRSLVFDGDKPFDEYAPNLARVTGGFFDYEASKTEFNYTDHLGTPHLSTDQTGAVVRTESMGPWGDNFTETNTTLDFTGFAAGFWDSENNAEHFGAREYQNTHGSWLSPDPLGGHLEDPQTLNKYSYANNNPVSDTDSTGLDSYLSCTQTKDNASTCQTQRVGGTEKDPQMATVQGVTGEEGFKATQIGNNPDGSGGLVDLTTGTGSYTASANGSGVQFSNNGGQTSSSGVFVNGTPQNTFQDAGFANGGALSGFTFTLTNSKLEAGQTEAGSFAFNGTEYEAGQALMNAGFVSMGWFGKNQGFDEFRSTGSGAFGENSAHFNVEQVERTPSSAVPTSGRGNMHFGEHFPLSLGVIDHIKESNQ